MYTVTQIHIQVNPTQSATRWVTLYNTVLLQREIAYRVDLFQSQVPCYNRSILYFNFPLWTSMYRVILVVADLGCHLTFIWMFEHLAQLPS